MTLNRTIALLAVFAMAAGVLAATTVYAQLREVADPDASQVRIAAEADAVVAHLKLEGEVADKVRAVLIERGNKIAKMRSEMRARRGSGQQAGNMRLVADAITKDTEKALAELLSEEQLKAYSSYMKEQRARRGRGRRGG